MKWRRWKKLEDEMQEELRSIREMAGSRELGNLTYAAEEARAQWRWTWLDNLWRDFCYAVRVLARQPGFTSVAVLSLGLGIGATAAIYSLTDRVLWRQLPIHEPERLVNIQFAGSYYALQQYAARGAEMLEGVAGTSGAEERPVSTGGEPQRANVDLVSGNYFQLLGTSAWIGRALLPEDDVRGQPERVAILSYKYWQRAFGGDPAVLGRQIRVAKVPFTVAGVARPEFFGVAVGQAPDLWLPLSKLHEVYPGRKWLDSRSTNFMALVARLRPGVTAERAAAALNPLARSIEIERAGSGLPEWIRKRIEGSQLQLRPASYGISNLRQRFSQPLRVLFALAGIVMLLVCVNVMGLQFARADERRRELSVRLAIGAGRWRVVRQLLTESTVLAVAGGLLGLAICRPAAAAVASLVQFAGQPVQLGLEIDRGALLFVLGIAFLATLVCGVAPALRATNSRAGLQQNARAGSAAPKRRILGRTVASVQIALSVVLIAGTFLFAFSLHRLTRFETGVDRRNLSVIDVEMREAGYSPAQMASLNRRIFERLRTIRGVETASFSGDGIFTGRNSNTLIGADGFQAAEGLQRESWWDEVGPQYFRALGTRIISGRDFDDRDYQTGAKLAIVNQAFVRHFFGGQNPLGRMIYRTADKIPMQVVGVIEDIRYNVRQPSRRYFYVPASLTESRMYTTRFVVRGNVAAADLRAAIRAEDAGARVLSIDAADELLNRTIDLDRLVAMLSFAFGILAVILAAVGIYGLLAYDITRRTGEIGIRMALGATKARVVGMVFREIVLLSAIGLTCGIAGALWLGRLVEGLIFELKPGNPLVLASAAAALAIVAAGAAWLPARRAASLDPMVALRHD